MNDSGVFKYEKNIEEFLETDVLVCGGGPAGTAAAISASRAGAETLLVEQNGFLGGTATAAEVGIWLGSYDRNGEYPVVGGLFREILEKLADIGGAVLPEDDIQIGEPPDPDVIGSPFIGYGPHGNAAPVKIESVKRISEKLVKKSGADILYFTHAIEPIYKNGTLRGVVLFSKDGFTLVEANRVVDATGDADLVARAGGEFRKGRPEDGKMAPATLMFSVDNVNGDEFTRYCKQTKDSRFRRVIEQLKEEDKWPFSFDIMIFMDRPFKKGRFMVNTLRQRYIDGTKAKSLTEGMIKGREKAVKLFRIAKNYVPGFENAVFDRTASRIGIRETRRIVGKYTLSEKDIIEGRTHEDSIALSGYKWDLPNPDRPTEQEMEGEEMAKPYIEIPYRSLVPRETPNVIVAGRAISTTWHALGPVREMPVCFAMGEAAGSASALSLEHNCDYSEINTGDLREKLETNGAICKNPEKKGN